MSQSSRLSNSSGRTSCVASTSPYHHLRQQNQLCEHVGDELLLQVQNYPMILYSLLSTRQWSGWDQQPHYPTAYTRASTKQKASGWIDFRGCYRRTGLQARSNGRNPVLIGLRDRSHHLYWHLYAHASHNRDWPKSKRHSTLSRPRSIRREMTGGSNMHCLLQQQIKAPTIRRWNPESFKLGT